MLIVARFIHITGKLNLFYIIGRFSIKKKREIGSVYLKGLMLQYLVTYITRENVKLRQIEWMWVLFLLTYLLHGAESFLRS